MTMIEIDVRGTVANGPAAPAAIVTATLLTSRANTLSRTNTFTWSS
ncbi:hypothetical protein [Nonomuraea sp. LPB2021202275-12-8]